MKMNSFRIICHALILIFLVAVSGCAKRMVAAKDADPAEISIAAVIKTIKVNEAGTQAEIATDRPLTYTSYKTSDPPRIFIDLAQTEPGQIDSVESVNGPIKSIKVSRQDFGSGFLSRVEIILRKDSQFSAKADAVDRGILNVILPLQETTGESLDAEKTNAKPVEVAAEVATINELPTAVGNTTETENSKTQTDDRVTVKDSTANIVPPNIPFEAKPAAMALKTFTGITVLNDKIVLAVAGDPLTFTSFKLDKPGRLVVDLFETKSAFQPNVASINRFGISKARIGISPEKVRIVFDSSKEVVPPYHIQKIDNGLSISFSEGSAEEPQSNITTSALVKPISGANKEEISDKGQVESIDFKAAGEYSRLEVKINGTCSPDKPLDTTKGILLNFKGCELPAKLQRTLDSKAFASTVLNITPYQVKIAGTTSTRILVKVRSKTPYSGTLNGNIYALAIKNPPVSVRSKEKAVVPPPQIEEELLATQNKDTDPAELPKSIVARQQPKKLYTGRKVTLEFSDADIRKIFQLIAEVSNLNFLIADDVTGTISIKLVNVPWDQALDVILDTKGLGMIREGNIVQIKPKAKMQSQADEEMAAKKARERGMEMRTEIFDVNYAAVTDIATQFGSVKSDRGVISTDARTNRVIVKDIATAIEDMKSLLKSLDTPEKQVMIEARIVEASTSFVRDLGVQWGIHYIDGSGSVAGISRLDTGFGGQVATAPTSGTSGPGAAVGMSFGKLTSNIQLDLRLSAAVTANQIKIMSTPRVVTLNNKPAKISQGASIPYQTTSAEGTKTEFVEAALTLEVTPHITADGSIGMKIKASNNSPGTGSPPPINKKEATTELLVKNGETTVIGGIYVDSDTESDTGVPFLQDIPLLGWLFKSNTKNKSKNELLIFITPKIVS